MIESLLCNFPPNRLRNNMLISASLAALTNTLPIYAIGVFVALALMPRKHH